MRTVLMFVALAFIVAGVAGFLYFLPVQAPYAPGPAEPVGCTLEVHACADGSFVGRTGPNCAFAPCPGPAQNGNGNVACDADVKQCSDGSYVSREGPQCTFAACPNAFTPSTKLPSHETIAALAGCTNEQKEWMWNYGEKKSWKCTPLESNIESTSFPPYDGYTFFSDPYSYGLDFPALTYYVSFTADQDVPVINKDCIQICGGPRLMAYSNNAWVSINTKEELLAASGTIDSPAEAFAIARYLTGNKVGEEVEIEGLESNATANGDGTFSVTLYSSTGGICCGTDYVYSRMYYLVDAQGNITEERTPVEVGVVSNQAIA